MRDRAFTSLDLNFLGTALVIAATGCLLIYSATYFTDPNLGIFHRQLLWIGIGIGLMFLFAFIDYHVFFDIAPILYGIGNVMLLYLLLWGRVTAHVKSWIHIGGFQFQPAEFMKAMAIIGLPVFLIFIQPDLGTAASFAPLIGVAMFFGGIRWRVWAIMAFTALVILPIGYFKVLHPYQRERVMIFLNPERDPLGSGYQVTQAKIAIGSGGIHGKGFKQGTQAKLAFLPARHTDFIFAVLGEEWGFIGVIIVLSLYLFLIIQALTFAKNARDRGGTFLSICLIAFFIFHVLINVSMQIGVLPTTGIPLPLISYGGSSTMMFFMAIGLLLNVDLRRFVNA
jgi:rod shape determining protein RodA